MTTATLAVTGGRPNCRCEVCWRALAETEVLPHLLGEHPDRFGDADVPDGVDKP